MDCIIADTERAKVKIMNTFNLLGKKITFSDEIMNFAKCYGHYRAMQSGADQLLCNIYDAYGTFTNLVNQAETDCSRIIYGFADTFVNKVIDAGFYDLSTEVFLEEYVARITRQLETISVCDAIVEKFVEIEHEKEEVKRYRELRKAARGRMIGGGFGLEGAVVGMAMAGTANVISGLGHSAVNAIGNIGTDAAAQREGRKIYESAQTKQRLREALENDLFIIFKGYLYLLEDKLGLHFRVRSVADQARVDTVVSNISQRKLSRDEAVDIIEELFQTDPYNDGLYCYILQRFGDSQLELQQIAEAFSMDKKLDDYKQAMLKKIVDDMPTETIEDCEKVIESLSGAIQRNGVSEDIGKEYLSVFRERIETLDREMRTFQDVVYETAEQAAKARETYEAEQAELEREKSVLERWKDEADFTDKESLGKLRVKIVESHFRIDEAEACLEDIDNNLERIDREERTVDGVLYENHESALLAVRQKEAYVICRDAVFEELGKLLDAGQYKEAIDGLRQMEILDEWRPKIETDWNAQVAVRFADKIEQSRKYQKALKEGGVKNIVMGVGGIMLIGLMVSFIFPFALPISVVIAVLGVVGMVMEKKENRSRKPAYQFVQQLIQYGYDIKIDKSVEGEAK